MGLVLFFLVFLLVQISAHGELRPAAVAGAFYPGDAEELVRVVDGFLGSSSAVIKADPGARVVGLISPHAGYQYSGRTAATAFKSISGQKFDRVYFLGVDHHSALPTISVWPDGGFDTPLGPVLVDATATAELRRIEPTIVAEPEQHRKEHSIEVLLPFFIKTIGMHPAVFISVGGMPENGLLLGKALIKQIAGFPGRVLIVASSDWSHYHDSATAKKLDTLGIETVLAMDGAGLLEKCVSGRTELCGLNGVIALLTVMKEAKAKGQLLFQADSSAGSGDTDRVVGYAAILLEAHANENSGGVVPGAQSEIKVGSGSSLGTATTTKIGTQFEEKTEVPKKVLEETPKEISKEMDKEMHVEMHKEALSAVRKTLESVLSSGKTPQISFKDPRFKQECGIFVTLKKGGDLRGCIGFIQGIRPLGDAIQEMAVSAATRDPRFPPVTLDELKEIDIEISILSPMIPVKNLEEIEVGRDGLLLRRGGSSGLLLPQVATEWGWDRDTFLGHLCLKAGLPVGSQNAPDADLYRFTAEVFGEKDGR